MPRALSLGRRAPALPSPARMEAAAGRLPAGEPGREGGGRAGRTPAPPREGAAPPAPALRWGGRAAGQGVAAHGPTRALPARSCARCSHAPPP